MDAETYPRTLRRRTANHNKRMQCTVRDAASPCQKLDAFACLHRTLGGHDKECLANLASSALQPVHSKPSTCASNPYRTLRLHREVLPGSPPLQGLHVEEVVRGIGLLSLPKKSLEIGRVLHLGFPLRQRCSDMFRVASGTSWLEAWRSDLVASARKFTSNNNEFIQSKKDAPDILITRNSTHKTKPWCDFFGIALRKQPC